MQKEMAAQIATALIPAITQVLSSPAASNALNKAMSGVGNLLGGKKRKRTGKTKSQKQQFIGPRLPGGFKNVKQMRRAVSTRAYKKAPRRNKRNVVPNQVNETLPNLPVTSGGNVGVNAPGGSILDIPTSLKESSVMKSYLTQLAPGPDPFANRFEESTRFIGAELIKVYTSGGVAPVIGETVFSLFLNPLQFLGSRLAKQAKLYTRFYFKSIEVIWTPDVAATTDGSLAMGYTTDAKNKFPEEGEQGLRVLMETWQANKFQVATPSTMSRTLRAPEGQPYFLRYSANPTVAGNMVNQGRICVKAGSTLSANKTYGSFFLKYDIVLYEAYNNPVGDFDAPLMETRGEIKKSGGGSEIIVNMSSYWDTDTNGSNWPATALVLLEFQGAITFSDASFRPGDVVYAITDTGSGSSRVIVSMYPTFSRLFNNQPLITADAAASAIIKFKFYSEDYGSEYLRHLLFSNNVEFSAFKKFGRKLEKQALLSQFMSLAVAEKATQAQISDYINVVAGESSEDDEPPKAKETKRSSIGKQVAFKVK